MFWPIKAPCIIVVAIIILKKRLALFFRRFYVLNYRFTRIAQLDIYITHTYIIEFKVPTGIPNVMLYIYDEMLLDKLEEKLIYMIIYLIMGSFQYIDFHH